ncbi:MAG: penicillin-binding protein activator [Pseudomonadota bacterium]
MKHKAFLLMAMACLLNACTQTVLPGGGYGQNGGFTTPQAPNPPAGTQQSPPVPQGKVLTVGALLPLSDPRIGQPMLNAMQMALEDLQAENVRLVVKDSGTTPAQAQMAAKDALKDGAHILVGPVYAESVRAVKTMAKATPILAFSTDTSVAGANTYLLSVLPGQQVERILAHAKSQGRNTIAIITTADAYGDIVTQTGKATLPQLGQNAPVILRVTPASATTAPLPLPPQTDAVLLALPPRLADTVASRLTPRRPALYGVGLWDDPALAQTRYLQGAEFSAPDPALRRRFENTYRDLYGNAPPRLATQAYDAIALASVLAMQGNGISAATIQARAGFNGLDGLFRLNPNGLPERGLAVLRVNDNGLTAIAPAPTRFGL